MQHLDVIPRAQLCKQLGVSSSTIKRWTETREFPRPLKGSGREPLYNRSQVSKWFLAMEAQSD